MILQRYLTLSNAQPPPHWDDLVHNSSELATKQDFNLAEPWFKHKTQPQLPPADNPIVDPYAVMTDHHAKRNAKRNRSTASPLRNPL